MMILMMRMMMMIKFKTPSPTEPKIHSHETKPSNLAGLTNINYLIIYFHWTSHNLVMILWLFVHHHHQHHYQKSVPYQKDPLIQSQRIFVETQSRKAKKGPKQQQQPTRRWKGQPNSVIKFTQIHSILSTTELFLLLLKSHRWCVKFDSLHSFANLKPKSWITIKMVSILIKSKVNYACWRQASLHWVYLVPSHLISFHSITSHSSTIWLHSKSLSCHIKFHPMFLSSHKLLFVFLLPEIQEFGLV